MFFCFFSSVSELCNKQAFTFCVWMITCVPEAISSSTVAGTGTITTTQRSRHKTICNITSYNTIRSGLLATSQFKLIPCFLGVPFTHLWHTYQAAGCVCSLNPQAQHCQKHLQHSHSKPHPVLTTTSHTHNTQISTSVYVSNHKSSFSYKYHTDHSFIFLCCTAFCS